MSNDTLSGYWEGGARGRDDPARHLSNERGAFVREGGGRKDSAIKADFENMARAYLRLADQAERNAHNDVVYELRLHRRIAINHRRDE